MLVLGDAYQPVVVIDERDRIHVGGEIRAGAAWQMVGGMRVPGEEKQAEQQAACQ